MRLRAPQTKPTDSKGAILKSRLNEKGNDLNVDDGDASAASDILREPPSHRAVGRRRSLYRFT